MKDWAKKTILDAGALRLMGSFRPASAAILMYHSVLPNPAARIDALGGIVHSEEVFRGQMELLARDFHPISLDEFRGSRCRGAGVKRRSVVVTFDDGYADNFEVAAPILQATGVPAIFYATVNSIEHRRPPWPARLRFALRTAKTGEWNDSAGRKWPLRVLSDRESAFAAGCETCCRLTGDVQESWLLQVERDLEVALPDQEAMMMTYAQLQNLLRQGHGVGSHTLSHPNLAQVSEDESRREITESRQQLESRLKVPVRHFAYPCPALTPHWNSRTVEQSRVAGYETGVTTELGVTGPGDNQLSLRRVLPTKTVEGLRWSLEKAFATG